MGQGSEESKGRRVSLDLSASAAQEVDRLRELTDLTTADMFRYALHLFRIYVQEVADGKSLYFAKTDDPQSGQTRIELPLTVKGGSAAPQRHAHS
jgi:hypothetical protein